MSAAISYAVALLIIVGMVDFYIRTK